MKIWKDREGNSLTPQQFMQKWKEGIKQVTPLQQMKSQILFSWITIIGILCGIIASMLKWASFWWIVIILLAALGNTIVGLIGMYQRYSGLIEIDNMLKGGTKDGF